PIAFPRSTTPRPAARRPLSLHDALPISLAILNTSSRSARTAKSLATVPVASAVGFTRRDSSPAALKLLHIWMPKADCVHDRPLRSEEHTSELQSRFDLVCRLLLENIKSQ